MEIKQARWCPGEMGQEAGPTTPGEMETRQIQSSHEDEKKEVLGELVLKTPERGSGSFCAVAAGGPSLLMAQGLASSLQAMGREVEPRATRPLALELYPFP